MLECAVSDGRCLCRPCLMCFEVQFFIACVSLCYLRSSHVLNVMFVNV